MRLNYFGDSFDIVKRFLLGTLGDDLPWVAYPMFTHAVSSSEVAQFEEFLGVTVASTQVLTPASSREPFVTARPDERFVFLDPDTGVRLQPTSSSKSCSYVFGPELVELCIAEPDRLALVFDQSVPRGSEEAALAGKLRYFADRGVSGFAYRSHACFLILSADSGNVEVARVRLLATGLPESRIVHAPDSSVL